MDNISLDITENNEAIELYILEAVVTANPATVKNTDSSYDTTVACGGTLIVPDSNISNSDSSFDYELPATTDLLLPDSTVKNSDESYKVGLPATSDLELADITHTDSDGSSVVYPSAKPFVCTPAVSDSYTAPLMQTGQTTSYRTGDDGNIQVGRDFYTLGKNNPFGNTNRFTDELGGQTYTNNIVIDWSTWDELNNTVLGYYRLALGSPTNYDWNGAIDAALAHSVGTFTSGWRLWNRKEAANMLKDSETMPSRHGVFNVSNGLWNRSIWTSTTLTVTTTSAYYLYIYGSIQYTAKSYNGYNAAAVRTFTVTGTTLT